MSAAAADPPCAAKKAGQSRMTRSGRMMKRTVDLCGSVLLLTLLAPVIGVLAVLIRLHDGGPAFYRRRVIGLRGPFDAFKLRSMHVDAEEILRRDPALRREFAIHFKLKDDPRVTRLGAFLRKTSLDEMPQLWNVLRGEMSLVGPRMISPEELEKFGEADWIFNCMKPGITGAWQVQGRTEAGYGQRVAMDLRYVENWSMALDFKILLQTPWRVARGTGAR